MNALILFLFTLNFDLTPDWNLLVKNLHLPEIPAPLPSSRHVTI